MSDPYSLPDPMAGSGIEVRGPYGFWYARAPPRSSPVTSAPPVVPVTTPLPAMAPAPLDPNQLASVLYDKAIPLGYSTKSQWGGRIIEGPAFDVIDGKRVVSFIAGYYIPVNFWDDTRTVSELYFRGQLAWSLTSGALMSDLNVGVATAGGAQTVRFNTGTLAQTPDDWSVARYGAQAVAYVPLVTATFENIRIAQFGNIVPFTSVTVEDTALGVPGDLVAWADAIEALARHDGRGADEFETVDVSGGINALILGSEINFMEFLGGMRKHKPQWNILTAEKLRLIEKGIFSLDLTLELAKLVNHEAQPITVHTSDAFDKRREKVCGFLDYDRDYEPSNARISEDLDPVIATDARGTDSYQIPVAAPADIVYTETSFAYYSEEVARTKSEFSGMAHYLALEPGDCYEWTSPAGRQYFHRVNEIVRRSDFTVDVKGEGFLNCAIGTSPAFGSFVGALDLATALNTTLTNSDRTATLAAVPTIFEGFGARNLDFRSSGRFYFEVTIGATHGNAHCVGVLQSSGTYFDLVYLGNNCTAAYAAFGGIISNNAPTGQSIGTFVAGDVIGVAVDFGARKAWFRRNGGLWNGQALDDPLTGVSTVHIASSGSFAPVLGFGGTPSSGNIGDNMTIDLNATL